MWGARIEVQDFKRELHTHIHLDYVRVEFLSCISKKFIDDCNILLPNTEIQRIEIWCNSLSYCTIQYHFFLPKLKVQRLIFNINPLMKTFNF